MQEAIKDGGNAARLNFLRLVKEPVAVALAYELETISVCDDHVRNVVVFDMGSRAIGK